MNVFQIVHRFYFSPNSMAKRAVTKVVRFEADLQSDDPHTNLEVRRANSQSSHRYICRSCNDICHHQACRIYFLKIASTNGKNSAEPMKRANIMLHWRWCRNTTSWSQMERKRGPQISVLLIHTSLPLLPLPHPLTPFFRARRLSDKPLVQPIKQRETFRSFHHMEILCVWRC